MVTPRKDYYEKNKERLKQKNRDQKVRKREQEKSPKDKK